MARYAVAHLPTASPWLRLIVAGSDQVAFHSLLAQRSKLAAAAGSGGQQMNQTFNIMMDQNESQLAKLFQEQVPCGGAPAPVNPAVQDAAERYQECAGTDRKDGVWEVCGASPLLRLC